MLWVINSRVFLPLANPQQFQVHLIPVMVESSQARPSEHGGSWIKRAMEPVAACRRKARWDISSNPWPRSSNS
jgi:hypothetical protein